MATVQDGGQSLFSGPRYLEIMCIMHDWIFICYSYVASMSLSSLASFESSCPGSLNWIVCSFAHSNEAEHAQNAVHESFDCLQLHLFEHGSADEHEQLIIFPVPVEQYAVRQGQELVRFLHTSNRTPKDSVTERLKATAKLQSGSVRAEHAVDNKFTKGIINANLSVRK